MSASALLPRRVLVVDDQPEIHADFRKILCPAEPPDSLRRAKERLFGQAAPGSPGEALRFDVRCAHQGQEGVREVARAREMREPLHVAFVDMRMPPGWDGLTTIRALWDADPNVQVVLCTAYSDESLDRVTTALGNADKLLVLKKPFEPIEVLQLATALSEKWQAERDAELQLGELERLVQERTAAIEHAALHDRLTELPNRALLLDRLASAIDLTRRDAHRRFALLFLDIDGFKGVNDSLGHAEGDRLLVRVAERIRHCLRASDVVSPGSLPARLGGDEFLVLIEGLTRASDVARVAERLLAALAEPHRIGAHQVSVSASIGIATSDRAYASPSDMLRDADIAMYRAKSAGGARYVLFDEAMHREVSVRLALEAAVRKAVADEALDLHYQPIVRLAGGRIEGFEALVRWKPAGGERVSPGELIGVAEETGLIQQLGLQLLRRGCDQLARWHAELPDARDLRLSVNLSRRQLLDSEFGARVAELIRASGVDATRLGLEITETSVLHDLEGAIAVLRQLRGLGAMVLLDDFGSGYSAIAHLHRMPLSAMKIDRLLLTQAHEEARHAVTLRAMVSIAKAFGLATVAEGIETRSQLALAESLEIDFGQGFLYSPAVPAEEAAEMIRRGRVLSPGEDWTPRSGTPRQPIS
jgi:diguanylate cyclase (GGDEF)-like protein